MSDDIQDVYGQWVASRKRETLEPEDDILSTESFRTHQLECLLRKKPADTIDIEQVKKLLRAGVYLDFIDSQGYTFIEKAGLIGRLDIADLMARSKYSDV